ncbi:hypothetical protein Slin14017_G094740 [Septoria linicola]|nr:hypothetical protein Slin14017_G094740 [Septoria linicola]
MSTSAAETPTTAPESSSAAAESSSVLSSISSAVSSSIVNEPPTTSAAPETTQTTPTTAPTTNEPTSTSTISESSVPPTTQVVTSVVTASNTNPGESNTPVTVVVTRTNEATNVPVTTELTSTGSSATSSNPALNTGSGSSGDSNGGGGLSTGGITAIAVVVPVAVVALLVLAGIFLWRKRKAKKAAEEARRKEVEDYGFNPNNDPTLPTVASENGAEMAEDNSGYRGWGAATAASRKLSTTLTSGHTQGQLSDAGSNGYRGAMSGDGSDGNSGDAMLYQRRETMNSDQVGALGQAPVAGTNPSGMKRGPSNASSTYSAGGHSDVSDVSPQPGSMPQSYEAYNPASGYGYSQHGPYGDGTYGGNPDGMPIVQDVSARRNTRIQQPGNYQQGNSGIAQNF